MPTELEIRKRQLISKRSDLKKSLAFLEKEDAKYTRTLMRDLSNKINEINDRMAKPSQPALPMDLTPDSSVPGLSDSPGPVTTAPVVEHKKSKETKEIDANTLDLDLLNDYVNSLSAPKLNLKLMESYVNKVEQGSMLSSSEFATIEALDINDEQENSTIYTTLKAIYHVMFCNYLLEQNSLKGTADGLLKSKELSANYIKFFDNFINKCNEFIYLMQERTSLSSQAVSPKTTDTAGILDALTVTVADNEVYELIKKLISESQAFVRQINPELAARVTAASATSSASMGRSSLLSLSAKPPVHHSMPTSNNLPPMPPY